MFDLGRFELRLSQEERLREEFLADPVGVLRREGLMLSPAQAQRLRDRVGRVQSGRPPTRTMVDIFFDY